MQTNWWPCEKFEVSLAHFKWFWMACCFLWQWEIFEWHCSILCFFFWAFELMNLGLSVYCQFCYIQVIICLNEMKNIEDFFSWKPKKKKNYICTPFWIKLSEKNPLFLLWCYMFKVPALSLEFINGVSPSFEGGRMSMREDMECLHPF